MKNLALMVGFNIYDLMTIRNSGLLFEPPCKCGVNKLIRFL